VNQAVRRAIVHWLALLLIASAMFAGAWLPLPPAVRPLLLLPSIGMAALIATGFMRLPAGGVLSWGFAVAALFWLGVLLSLASIDPLTRRVYPAGVTVPGEPVQR
jgi:uncharacterized membrane protein